MVVADRVPWIVVIRLQAPMLAAISACGLTLVLLDRFGSLSLHASPTPFQIVGVALAILVGFRNNAAYDRWWEGRKLWGGIINASRSLARQMTSFTEDSEAARRVLMRHVAWAHALAAHLRGEPAAPAAAPWLSAVDADRVAGARNVPETLLELQGRDLVALGVSEERLARLDSTLTELANHQGGCERIRNTPLPVAYRFFTRAFVRGYCLLLPFGLLETLGVATIFVVAAMAFVFLVVETVGGLLQDPFTRGAYGLPLSAMSRTIEIDLRSALGERDLPAPLAPVDVGNGLQNLL
jgi:putative membrane protein